MTTYRGVLAVGLGSAAGYTLQSAVPAFQPSAFRALPSLGVAALGFAFGVPAMLSDLPNSLLKLQCGIDPGAPGHGRGSALFYVLDQVDLLLGAWLVAWPWISSLGALLGMRASAR